MAVANDNPERDLRLDPQLARIYAAAGDTEDGPAAALDAAILAAARREVGAGPTVLGAAPRTQRRWLVPLSLAAVLTLSVSLVTLVHEEKGDDLTQAPASVQAPASAPMASRPAPASAPTAGVAERDAKGGAATSMKDTPTAEPAKVVAAPDRAKVTEQQQAPEPVEAKRKEAARSADADFAKTPAAGALPAQTEKRVAQAFPKADAEASAPVTGTSMGAVANAPAREAEVARDAVAVRAPPLPPPAPSIPAPVVTESPRRSDNTASSTVGVRGSDGAGTVATAPPPDIAAAKPAEGYADGRVALACLRRTPRGMSGRCARCATNSPPV